MLSRKSIFFSRHYHSNCTKSEKFKMVAKAVEKKMQKWEKAQKRAVILSFDHLLKHIYTNTSASSKKSKDLNLDDSGRSKDYFRGNHSISKLCKQMRFFFDLLIYIWD